MQAERLVTYLWEEFPDGNSLFVDSYSLFPYIAEFDEQLVSSLYPDQRSA